MTSEEKKQRKTKFKKIIDKIFMIIGALCLLLGIALSIRKCTIEKASAWNAQDGREIGDIVQPFNELPLTFTIGAYNTNTYHNYEKLTRCYLSIELTYQGMTDGKEYYDFNKIELKYVLTGDGLTQLVYDFKLEGLINYAVADTGYLVLMIYYNDTTEGVYGTFASSEYDYIRQCYNKAYDSSLLTGAITQKLNSNGSAYDEIGDFLYNNCDDSSFYPHTDENEYYMLGFFQIEMLRLIELATAYNVGYMTGYSNGISWFERHYHDYGLYDDNDLQAKYNEGYQRGLDDAQAYSIPVLIYTIFNAPMSIINGAFNFEILGVNVANIIKFFITIGCVIFVISFFKSK